MLHERFLPLIWLSAGKVQLNCVQNIIFIPGKTKITLLNMLFVVLTGQEFSQQSC
jgi:hypothetical protein